jgi:WD40 repeat protein
MTLKPGNTNLPGHTKRIFCVKFDKTQDSIIYSGGWDDAVYVSDLRSGGKAVSVIPGPHVCGGDGIDVVGNLMVAASYRNQRNLEMFDIRNPSKVLQYLEMDAKTSNHYSETLLYAT